MSGAGAAAGAAAGTSAGAAGAAAGSAAASALIPDWTLNLLCVCVCGRMVIFGCVPNFCYD